MRSYLFVLLMGLASGTLLAQENQDYLHNRALMERIPSAVSGGNAVMLGNLGVATPGIVGDVYLAPDYRIAVFWLYADNQVVQGYAARLDLQRNEFDIHMGKGNGIKAMPGSKVRTMMWADSLTKTPQYFVNGQEYKNQEGVPYLGFFQILSEGELTLLRLTTVIFKPADHNPTHYTGSKDNRFIKRSKLFYAIGTTALELPNRKGILKLMESRKDQINTFIKVNELNLGDERHVNWIFDHYNSLTKK